MASCPYDYYVDNVISDGGYGPQGGHYEECKLYKDSTLSFIEHWQYDGDLIVLSSKHYRDEDGEYWNQVKRKLEEIKSRDSLYYDRIMKMLDNNNVVLPI